MTEFETLEILESTAKNKDKVDILESHKGNDRFVELLKAALDFYRKFNIHKFGDMPEHSDSTDDLHDEFVEILRKLEHHEIKGNDAKYLLFDFFSRCNEQQQKWYRRVLDKNLRVGVSVKTANKVFNIPVFEVMLATSGRDCGKLEDIVNSGVYVSQKMDGYRCVAIVEDGEATLYSRNGTVYKNFPKIESSLSRSFPDGTIVLDGEIMSDDFQSMQKSAFANKRGTTVGDVKFFVFDYIPADEWFTNNFRTKKSDRLSKLDGVSVHFEDCVVPIENTHVSTVKEVEELEAKFLKEGFEGAIAVPDIPYYRGKKKNKMLKFKPEASMDCDVVGFYEGKINTKNEGKMGGLVLKQENGEQCECGTGFSDEDREYIWNNKDEFLGRKVEIAFDSLTNDGIMRFPRFSRWRNDKQ